ncbi:MAG TPA: hypothetical protein VNP98_01130 [Chthoniobacterales bacterium]|nr:hypothetical protein [Chthoniobacterales bacterium]
MRAPTKISCLIVWAVIATTASAGPQYQIFDIGVVQAGDTASQGFGISSAGVAVGRSFRSGGAQAFSWTQGGGLTGLPNLAGRNFAVSNDANDSSTVVGTAANTAFGAGRLPVIWQSGAVSQLPLPAGETIGDAHGVNALDVAVGSVDGGSLQQAVIYYGGNATVLTQTTPTGCFFVTAFGINNTGRIVGQGIDPNNAARNVGIVYDMGSPAAFEVGALPGANGALAFGVGNGGHVVGSSMMNQGSGMPFVWLQATGMVAIPLAAGTSEGSARAVNSAGWVVGQDSSAFSIPFLWDGATTYRLADLLPPGSGWDLSTNTSSSALGISDDGVIVGTGVHNGETRAYAMVPSTLPTPSPPPNPCLMPYFRENFDGVTAPALPAGWVASFVPGPANCTPSGTCALSTNWATSAIDPLTPPNCAFHNAPGCVTDSTLDTPSFFYGGPPGPTSGAFMRMAHNYDLETGQDGAVLEISINGGPFLDIVAAGGSVENGGYTGTIATGTHSPIAGRAAWTGNSGGYVQQTILLPAAATNQQIRFRFRLATDCQQAGTGWRIDFIEVVYLAPCPSPTPPPPSPTPTPTATPTPPPTPTPTPGQCVYVFLDEDFDGVTAPALPAGWSSTFTPGPADCLPTGTCPLGTNWETSTTDPSSPPNCAFHNAPGCVTDSSLDSPVFFNAATNPVLTFSHNYDLPTGLDGAVLEISINGGPFVDFVAAGGVFNGGGYNGTISSGTHSPIAGRQAWTGTQNNFTVATMPNAAGGQGVVLRFRLATDCSGAGSGWRLDDIKVTFFVPCPSPTPTPLPATHFEVVAPSIVGMFQGFNFTVRAVDQFGNTATGYAGTIHFTSTGQSSLPPDSTLTNGTGTFAATFFTEGNHTITATDTLNPSITGTSNDILVVDDQVTPPPTPTPTPTVTPTPSPTPPPSPTPIQALNLSTRMRVQTGDNAGIGGFIITGTDSKQVLLRGIGPSLGASGISDLLANPTLDLRDSSGVRILANNDWRDDPAQEALIEATGIPPTDDLEAAIVQTLTPGSYTVILRGMGMTSGVGLVEIYDLNQGVDSKLANLSTRAFIDTGNNIVIAGFILGGSGNDRIVVRGIGPSLTALGVPNALPDPTLELRDGNGALLMANNDWQDDPDQAAELTAAGLAPTNQLESGIARTLAPGLYTALLAGANNGTGVGLVEVYDRGPP